MKACKSSRSSAEEQLILLSAGTSARRLSMRSQAQQLASQVDWAVLVRLLGARRLMPTLGPRIVELTGGDPGGELERTLETALGAARRQGALLALVATRVQGSLADAGIRCAPLKGPSLSEAIYGDPGRRLAADVDLLVAPTQLAEAVAVVCDMGYAKPTDYVDECGLPLLHFALVHERGELPPVELHWRVHCYEDRFAEERLLAPAGDLSSDWRAAPVDELAALLLFYARDGFMNLRLAADIGAWWDIFGSSLEPAALDEPMDVYPALERALVVSASVAERMVGLPMGKITRRGARLSPRERIAVRLADPHPHVSDPQVYANMGLIDGLLTPPGGMRAFVGREVILPREVLGAHARARPGRRPNTRSGHGVRVLARYARAMAGLLCSPQSALPQ